MKGGRAAPAANYRGRLFRLLDTSFKSASVVDVFVKFALALTHQGRHH